MSAYQMGRTDGIGFMLNGTQIAAIDLDKCRDPATGALDQWAADIVADAREEGAYIETTVSGTGIRIIGLSDGPSIHRKWTINANGSQLELFRNTPRYITISALQIGQCSELPELALFDRLLAKYDAHPKANNGSNQNGFDFNDAPEQFGDVEDIIRNGVPQGQRSEAFQYVVGQLAAQGLTPETIEQKLRAYPGGIAAKYWNRLRQEIERSYSKCRERQERKGADSAAFRTKGQTRRSFSRRIWTNDLHN
jgi:hypothetical protein